MAYIGDSQLIGCDKKGSRKKQTNNGNNKMQLTRNKCAYLGQHILPFKSLRLLINCIF